MVAGCGSTCMKYLLFVFNVIFFLVGVAAVGVGIWVLVDKNHMSTLSKVTSDPAVQEFNVPGLLQSGAIVLIVGGAVLVVLGFLGCCGAVKEIKCMLCLYAGLLILILIVEIVAGVLAAIKKNEFESKLKENLVKNLHVHYDGNLTSTDLFSRALDWAQVNFECCAVENITEFQMSPWWNDTRPSTQLIPLTCCVPEDKSKFFDENQLIPKNANCQISKVEWNAKPCYGAVRKWLVDRAAILIGIAFGIAGLQIFGVIFACCLIRAIKEGDK